jgi:hypothetical protein
VVADEHGDSGRGRVVGGQRGRWREGTVERVQKGLMETGKLLTLRHVGVGLEAHQWRALGGVDRVHVAGHEVGRRGEVISACAGALSRGSQFDALPPGSVNRKVVPVPSSLSTPIRPPCASTIVLQM